MLRGRALRARPQLLLLRAELFRRAFSLPAAVGECCFGLGQAPMFLRLIGRGGLCAFGQIGLCLGQLLFSLLELPRAAGEFVIERRSTGVGGFERRCCAPELFALGAQLLLLRAERFRRAFSLPAAVGECCFGLGQAPMFLRRSAAAACVRSARSASASASCCSRCSSSPERRASSASSLSDWRRGL